MSGNAFGSLCQILENSADLRGTRHLTVSEQVEIFVSILGHHKKNCVVKYDFICSGRQISKHFHSVLRIVLWLQPLLLPHPTPISEECQGSRWRWFMGCLGALDATHVEMNPADEEMTSNPRRYRGKSDKTSAKRTWTQREQEVLVNALRTICCTGWRYENGFRAGYLNQLEALMFKQFPDTNLRAEPHINSKIHVWKKYYSALIGMMGKSGLGWDDNRCMVTVDSQDVWDEYWKIDPTARTMCYKSWSFIPTWHEIFGQDRAKVGRILEILNEHVHPTKSNLGQTDTQDCYVPTTEWNLEFGYVRNDRAASEEIQVTQEPNVQSTGSNGKTLIHPRKERE
ncbi:UNVERIFIED_CONTAM: hypothetical protein Sangu_1021200 [Sesamum angustifolium]|uniref:Myb/SANT-like domain-containing protein n=1 Tax=Sesamum angustifolium TaxID=2727405 RepID=A0AAW2NZ58_9LAMI